MEADARRRVRLSRKRGNARGPGGRVPGPRDVADAFCAQAVFAATPQRRGPMTTACGGEQTLRAGARAHQVTTVEPSDQGRQQQLLDLVEELGGC